MSAAMAKPAFYSGEDLVTVIDAATNQHETLWLDTDSTPQDIIGRFKWLGPFKLSLPEDKYFLQLQRTGKTLSPSESLKEAHVRGGDVLVLGNDNDHSRTSKIQLPTDIAEQKVEQLKAKLEKGARIDQIDIESLGVQIDSLRGYLQPSVPLIFPDPQKLAVRLVKADLLNIMEEYRSDENKWYSVAWAFIGATLGVIVNWITSQEVYIGRPALVIIGAFIIMAVLSWVQAQNYGRRVSKLKDDLLIDSAPELFPAPKNSSTDR